LEWLPALALRTFTGRAGAAEISQRVKEKPGVWNIGFVIGGLFWLCWKAKFK
jgi:hypothetical protein